MSFNVLMYHEIRESADCDQMRSSPISVAQPYEDALPTVLFSFLNDFQAQMNSLKTEGYHTLTLQEIKDFYEKGIDLPEKSVLLTFDDAFQSVYRYAYPILKEQQFHAVCFVVLGWLSQESQPFDPKRSIAMSKEELKKMQDVFEFANHTNLLHMRHPDGATEMQVVSLPELKNDVAECGEYVDVPDVFAYPFGIYGSDDVKRLAKSGIRYAFTTLPGVNTKETPLLELHRDTVRLGCTLEEFKRILERGSGS